MKNTKISRKYPYIFVLLGYQENFLGTQKRVRISHGKRAIGVRVIEVLLYKEYIASLGSAGQFQSLSIMLHERIRI